MLPKFELERIDARYTSPTEKLTIGSLDDPSLTVRAQYNPKDIQIDRAVPWTTNNVRDNRPSHLRIGSATEAEYVGATPRTMTIELLFDRYEVVPTDWSQTRSIEPLVEMLDEMACVRNPELVPDDMRRPHHCVVAWGAGSACQGMRSFRCVIESLSVKYSMFDRDGTPVRATCTVKLREANVVTEKAKWKKSET
jgi:hypothetical protein